MRGQRTHGRGMAVSAHALWSVLILHGAFRLPQREAPAHHTAALQPLRSVLQDDVIFQIPNPVTVIGLTYCVDSLHSPQQPRNAC